MAVKSTPVQHEEVDFADMCARLQHQLSSVEGQMAAKMNEQSEQYENTIRKLREQVREMGRSFSHSVACVVAWVGLS
jgi:type VI protein secretion system component VasF